MAVQSRDATATGIFDCSPTGQRLFRPLVIFSAVNDRRIYHLTSCDELFVARDLDHKAFTSDVNVAGRSASEGPSMLLPCVQLLML
jgi:hypothetical protein